MAPGCSVRLRGLLAFVRALARAGEVLGSWRESEFPLSASSAYRWARRWRRNTAHIRAALYRLRAPPPEGDTTTDLHTLRHLDACFGAQPCALAAFQSHFGAAVFPH